MEEDPKHHTSSTSSSSSTCSRNIDGAGFASGSESMAGSLWLNADDIEHLRGRFEQLEYGMTTMAPSSVPSSSCEATLCLNNQKPVEWKDFRRVSVELEILREELLLLETDANSNTTGTAPSAAVDPKDVVECLQRCHPRLRSVWHDFVKSKQKSKNTKQEQHTEETDPQERHEEASPVVSMTVPESVGSPALVPPPRATDNHATTPAAPSDSRRAPQQPQRLNSTTLSDLPFMFRAQLAALSVTSDETESQDDRNDRRRRINMLLDQCETTRFPFKKKLSLARLGMSHTDIPCHYLCSSSMGKTLYKLSLSSNPLGALPDRIVTILPALRHLDVSECSLHELPDVVWNLPRLKTLNLSNNRFRELPDEKILHGLPELVELNLYGNKIDIVTIPKTPTTLSKLEVLNLGYNDIAHLPKDLARLTQLKSLSLTNNFIERVPIEICCDMPHLKTLDVSFNPMIQPPIETCDRGLAGMRHHYHALQMKETASPRKAGRVNNRTRTSVQRLFRAFQYKEESTSEAVSSVP